jgi:hypothetical protein
MTTDQLVRELENVTDELLTVADADLDRIQEILERRSAAIARIAAYNPGSFTADELPRLRKALCNGDAAHERLIQLRRGVAACCQLNHLRSCAGVPSETKICISA